MGDWLLAESEGLADGSERLTAYSDGLHFEGGAHLFEKHKPLSKFPLYQEGVRGCVKEDNR